MENGSLEIANLLLNELNTMKKMGPRNTTVRNTKMAYKGMSAGLMLFFATFGAFDACGVALMPQPPGFGLP